VLVYVTILDFVWIVVVVVVRFGLFLADWIWCYGYGLCCASDLSFLQVYVLCNFRYFVLEKMLWILASPSGCYRRCIYQEMSLGHQGCEPWPPRVKKRG